MKSDPPQNDSVPKSFQKWTPPPLASNREVVLDSEIQDLRARKNIQRVVGVALVIIILVFPATWKKWFAHREPNQRQADILPAASPPLDAVSNVPVTPPPISPLQQNARDARFNLTQSSDTRNLAQPPVANEKRIPSDETCKKLILESLLDFNEAIRNQSFNSFHGHISRAWKEQITSQKLTEVFQSFIDKNINIASITSVEPVLSEPPQIDSNELLILEGYYPAHPLKVNFKLKYVYEHLNWKLFGINVNVN